VLQNGEDYCQRIKFEFEVLHLPDLLDILVSVVEFGDCFLPHKLLFDVLLLSRGRVYLLLLGGEVGNERKSLINLFDL
jgi:hypothetical protein